MRLLFTFIGGAGHLEPLLPVARACVEAGHEVAVAGAGRPVQRVAALGLQALPTSAARPSSVEGRDLSPLPALDLRQDEADFVDSFAVKGARRHATAVHDHIKAWRPDLVVRDETDFGSAIAAERAGIPVVVVQILASGDLIRTELVAPALGELRSEFGLAQVADPVLGQSTIVLSPFPPSFRRTTTRPGVTVHAFRPQSQTPTRPPRLGMRAHVYATLGTAFATRSGDLFERYLLAARQLDADVLVTVGPDIDPHEFGPQPAHVRIARFVPQTQVLSSTDAVLSHGGSGTLTASLANGLPSVLTPLGADQGHNARRAAQLDLGIALDAATASADDIYTSVAMLLADNAYRDRALDVQTEINALPGVEHSLGLLTAAIRDG